MASDLTPEELAELRKLLEARQKVGPWYGNLRPFDFGEWGSSTAALLAAAGNALPALLDMAERCADYDRRLGSVMPADFKDWHQNSPKEWPEVAAGVVTNLRERLEDYTDPLGRRIEGGENE